MSRLSEFLHPERPYQDAQEEIRRALEEAQGYQRPFMEAGMSQYGNLEGAIGNLLNPVDFQNQLLSGYEESPYARALQDAAQERGMQAANQMGMGGSSNAIGAATETAGNIASKDRQQYLQNLLGMYGKGIDTAGGIYNTGANMGANMGGQALSAGTNIANLGMQGAQARNQQTGAGLGALASLVGNYLTGGMGGTGEFGRGMFTPEF